jgi:hypothetical protein
MKTQIVLPEALGEELKRLVPTRKRSEFIAGAIESRIRMMKFRRALKDSAGAWTDRNHPGLRTQTDVNRHLARFRGRLAASAKTG